MKILLALANKKSSSAAIRCFIDHAVSAGHEVQLLIVSEHPTIHKDHLQADYLISKIPAEMLLYPWILPLRQLPSLVPIDIMNRFESRQWLYSSLINAFRDYPAVTIPPFFTFERGKPLDLHAQSNSLWIVKTEQACSAAHAHQMRIMNTRQLLNTHKEASDGLWLAQKFVDHDAVLFKCYVVGEQHCIKACPSLPNATELIEMAAESQIAADYILSFDSQSMGAISGHTGAEQKFAVHINHHLTSIIGIIKQIVEPDLQMFGFDLIVCREQLTINIIDLNYFPSYSPMTREFAVELLRLIIP
jgi:hypothetical protein